MNNLTVIFVKNDILCNFIGCKSLFENENSHFIRVNSDFYFAFSRVMVDNSTYSMEQNRKYSMKKSVFLFPLLLMSVVSTAQIGVGTHVPHESAALEIVATDKGVLLPRVELKSLTDNTTIVSVSGSAQSLLVYNTGSEASETQEGLPEGYYYWSGNKWVRIINSDDVTSLVNQNETLTTLQVQEASNSSETENEQEWEEEGQRKVYTLLYNDEKGEVTKIDVNELVQQTESITSMSYDPEEHVLVYFNEEGEEFAYSLRDMVGDSQTLTLLSFNADERELLYTDELGYVNHIDLRSLVRSPWYDAAKKQVATTNGENIYTEGWVGIGFSEPSDAPEERLRVNGSITAVNSYYADYVFEDYFDGFSTLKEDYAFKPLEEVEAYISKYRHLPGITPVNELVKMEEGYSFNVSELSIQLLEKTEELYLHSIEQAKNIKSKEQKIEVLTQQIQSLEQQTAGLAKQLQALERMLLEEGKVNESIKTGDDAK